MTPLTRHQVAALAGISSVQFAVDVKAGRMGLHRARINCGGRVKLFDGEHQAVINYIAARQAQKAARRPSKTANT